MHALSLRIIQSTNIIKEVSQRSAFIQTNDVPKRINQAIDLLQHQYLRAEPILAAPLKHLLAGLIAISLILIITRLSQLYDWKITSVIVLLLILLLPLASIGLVILLQEWHLPPRVFIHLPLLVSLLFLNTFNYALPKRGLPLYKSVGSTLCAIIVVIYALIGNQITADRQRINQWDAMLANRLVGRLESMPGYDRLKRIIIYGGSSRYGRNLITSQVDMNISAFSKDWSKISILAEATGNSIAVQSQPSAHPHTCHASWPEKESIVINNDTAIICLPAHVLP